MCWTKWPVLHQERKHERMFWTLNWTLTGRADVQTASSVSGSCQLSRSFGLGLGSVSDRSEDCVCAGSQLAELLVTWVWFRLSLVLRLLSQ